MAPMLLMRGLSGKEGLRATDQGWNGYRLSALRVGDSFGQVAVFTTAMITICL